MNRLTPLAVILLITVFLTLFIIGPVFTIWALNLLFATNIPVTFWTWLSVLWLQAILIGSRVKTGDK